MPSNFSVTVILPTYNEEESLEVFIPELEKVLSKFDYEILVVDDDSSDQTANVVVKYSEKNNKIRFIQRKSNPSLPLSIYEGVKNANKNFVMWLDADGSMDAQSVLKLIENCSRDINKVYVGSRFVEGGGYKGRESIGNFKLKKFLNSIFNSEDAILAIFLSLIFNRLLSIVLNINVKDLTSGFIIGNKSLFEKEMFTKYIYGEYFINVLTVLHLKQIVIQEVGYFCKPRLYGESKTSTNILRMVSLTSPYVRTAINSRKLINENIR